LGLRLRRLSSSDDGRTVDLWLCDGHFSSRKLEEATHDNVPVRFITVNQHHDHDTIAASQRRFLEGTEVLFTQVLQIAHEMGVLKMGKVALDGSKIEDPRQRQPPQRCVL